MERAVCSLLHTSYTRSLLLTHPLASLFFFQPCVMSSSLGGRLCGVAFDGTVNYYNGVCPAPYSA